MKLISIYSYSSSDPYAASNRNGDNDLCV